MNEHTSGAAGTQRWVDSFGELPSIGDSIYAVNPNIPVDLLLQEASCLVGALADIAVARIELGIPTAQAWLMESDLRRVYALLSCIEAKVVRAQIAAEHREAA